MRTGLRLYMAVCTDHPLRPLRDSVDPAESRSSPVNKQIIDIRIPEALAPSVHQAMVYALRHSGYRLCSGAGDVALLFLIRCRRRTTSSGSLADCRVSYRVK